MGLPCTRPASGPGGSIVAGCMDVDDGTAHARNDIQVEQFHRELDRLGATLKQIEAYNQEVQVTGGQPTCWAGHAAPRHPVQLLGSRRRMRPANHAQPDGRERCWREVQGGFRGPRLRLCCQCVEPGRAGDAAGDADAAAAAAVQGEIEVTRRATHAAEEAVQRLEKEKLRQDYLIADLQVSGPASLSAVWERAALRAAWWPGHASAGSEAWPSPRTICPALGAAKEEFGLVKPGAMAPSQSWGRCLACRRRSGRWSSSRRCMRCSWTLRSVRRAPPVKP